MRGNTDQIPTSRPYWEITPLQEMTQEQWEALCDRCGRCCLHKICDDETDEIYYTSVACRLLDINTCQCTDYPNRLRRVRDCMTLTAKMLPKINWLPPDCAYRRVSEGKSLPPWHPLLTHTPQSVISAGASVSGRCISERQAGALEDYLVTWPQESASPCP